MYDKLFLSCDWGTSSFRLRMVKIDGSTIVAEEINDNGIASTFRQWTEQNGNESERISFYLSYLYQQIMKLEHRVGYTLKNLPLLVSGMASSSIGMKELPYKSIPFKTDGSDLLIEVIPPSGNFANPVFLVSGAMTEDDVLRGEETLLIGCEVNNATEIQYIFPGTHSKHIRVSNGMATGCKTYMTGEFFELLSTRSILSNSVKRNLTDNEEGRINPFFDEGVMRGSASNILNSAFHVRTNQLFIKNTAEENYQYLSGLLIGLELQDLTKDPPPEIILVCGKTLRIQYWRALILTGLNKKLAYISADQALINGHLHILESISDKKKSL